MVLGKIWRAFMAQINKLAKRPSFKGLNQFQADNKLLLMAYNQTEMRKMGQVTANLERMNIEKTGDALIAKGIENKTVRFDRMG